MGRLLAGMLFFMALGAQAQVSTELDIKVASDTAVPFRGPNMSYYRHWFFGMDFLLPGEQNQVVRYGRSNGFLLGFRMIRKVAGIFSVGADLGYRSRIVQLKNYLPDSVTGIVSPRSESLLRRSAEACVFFRFRSNNRGMAIGNYLDLGLVGDYAFQMRYRIKDEGVSGGLLQGRMRVLEIRNPAWSEPLGAHLMARVGFNKISFFGLYRILSPVKNGVQAWSPYSAGFQFSF